jgi:hypothetical protein
MLHADAVVNRLSLDYLITRLGSGSRLNLDATRFTLLPPDSVDR